MNQLKFKKENDEEGKLKAHSSDERERNGTGGKGSTIKVKFTLSVKFYFLRKKAKELEECGQ